MNCYEYNVFICNEKDNIVMNFIKVFVIIFLKLRKFILL